jgi:hypothetical protein
MHCSECAKNDAETPAVAHCPSCGAALCAGHHGSRPGPGGTSIGCRHGDVVVVLRSGGLRRALAA